MCVCVCVCVSACVCLGSSPSFKHVQMKIHFVYIFLFGNYPLHRPSSVVVCKCKDLKKILKSFFNIAKITKTYSWIKLRFGCLFIFFIVVNLSFHKTTPILLGCQYHSKLQDRVF